MARLKKNNIRMNMLKTIKVKILQSHFWINIIQFCLWDFVISFRKLTLHISENITTAFKSHAAGRNICNRK